MATKPVIGVLLGDAAGVGPELVAKCAAANFYEEYCRPVIIGDLRVFERALKVIGAEDKVKVQVISDVDEADWSKGLPVLDQKNLDPEKVPFATKTVESGKACLDMLKLGVELWQAGKIGGYVFGPLNKAGMHEAGLTLESEHHYLAQLLGHTEPFGEINVTNGLYTTRTTSHIPISQVSHDLCENDGLRIKRAIRLSYRTLTSAGIENPRIGVAALNPHCGENGDCGREEIDVIKPAIEWAQKEGINAMGPFPSDIVFHKALVKKEFDGVVTMYHDQGQIALKLIGFEGGITVAGGFPIPIVTCGHGTAYDIAGKGIVTTASFENAVKQCSTMAAVSAK
ncbi:MAG: 4-hydroxythreonine-4-phosphate dehydrogenase PdxA [Lachnospiraceae bacterium]|nr:4-hydroxythreonine-4-phosphate dehydrogenase PdxA [Clostridiaceae bacterium]